MPMLPEVELTELLAAMLKLADSPAPLPIAIAPLPLTILPAFASEIAFGACSVKLPVSVLTVTAPTAMLWLASMAIVPAPVVVTLAFTATSTGGSIRMLPPAELMAPAIVRF